MSLLIFTRQIIIPFTFRRRGRCVTFRGLRRVQAELEPAFDPQLDTMTERSETSQGLVTETIFHILVKEECISFVF